MYFLSICSHYVLVVVVQRQRRTEAERHRVKVKNLRRQQDSLTRRVSGIRDEITANKKEANQLRFVFYMLPVCVIRVLCPCGRSGVLCVHDVCVLCVDMCWTCDCAEKRRFPR